MTNFNDKLNAQLHSRQQEDRERESSQVRIFEENQERQRQAKILGIEVVNTLISHNIPKQPIWINKKITEQKHNRQSLRLSKQGGIDHIFEYQKWKMGGLYCKQRLMMRAII